METSDYTEVRQRNFAKKALTVAFNHYALNSYELTIHKWCEPGCDITRYVSDLDISDVFNLNGIPRAAMRKKTKNGTKRAQHYASPVIFIMRFSDQGDVFA